MNEFTKDELERIENRLYRTQLLSDDPLINKIQSMIDNYCEHNQHTPVLGDLNAYQCDSCNEIILR